MRIIFFTLASMLLLPVTIFAGTLLNLKVLTHTNQTRLELVLDKKTTGKVIYENSNNLIKVNLKAVHSQLLIPQQFSQGLIKKIKLISLKNVLQIQLALKQKVSWQINYSPIPSSEKTKIIVLLKPKGATPVSLKDKSAQIKKFFAKDIAKQQNVATKALNRKQQLLAKTKIFTVVIDAGHGGKDPGATSATGLLEKNIVLAISRAVAKQLHNYKNIKVVLTRQGDYFVPLRQRLNLARKGAADVFLAIHADAYFNHQAHGASVYALSARGATSEAARWLAQKDQYTTLDDINFSKLYDQSHALRSFLIDLAQMTTQKDSLLFGNIMLNELQKMTRLHNSKVEMAPFVVLKSPDIPSLLIETGFITHPQEAYHLSQIKYQTQIAQAIAQAVLNFKAKYQS